VDQIESRRVSRRLRLVRRRSCYGNTSEYQTYELDAEEVNIVGRVVWAAKRL